MALKMKRESTGKARKQIESKMATVFAPNLRLLSPQYRKILVDDLVSAFESRLLALSRAQTNMETITVIEEKVQIATQ